MILRVLLHSFQNICQEVDGRREDIKWLVKTLDALTHGRDDEEAVEEQHNLEELITRYKNLIPTIEMTVNRTELYSKCYVYTREVKEVCMRNLSLKNTHVHFPTHNRLS